MEKLDNKYHPHSLEENQDPFLMLLLFIVFPPITIYYKFEQFYNHLKNEHSEDPKIPNGRNVILHTIGGMLVIFMTFLLIVFTGFMNFFVATALVAVAFGIHLAYYHYHWQKEFNTHVLKHQNVSRI